MSYKILIVDDILENRKLLASIIKEQTDYEVITARSGLDVISMLDDEQIDTPDLILLDVMMPELNGFDVAARLKEDPRSRDIPIIFITGLTDTKSKVKGFESGGADYISKPFNKLELLARVNTQLRLKKNEDSLRQKNLELEELNKTKNIYLGIVAHDLRNPLMTISGVAELFLMKYKEELTDDQKRFVDIIKRSGSFMKSLVEDFLDYSAIEAGKLTLNLKAANISQLIRENVTYNKSLAEGKGIELELNCDEDLPQTIFVDEHKMLQVINNLVSNAIKFSHPRTKIEVSLKQQGEALLFFVKDQGQGIPESELDKLFAPFSRTSIKSTAGEGGSGLGLVIVKKIVNGHGGKIWVESQVGQGTTFYVTIPLRQSGEKGE